MKLHLLDDLFAVCKLPDFSGVHLSGEIFFMARTDTEFSLVCPEKEIPANAIAVERGWRAMGVAGPLEFFLVGVISELAGILAREKLPIFAISTFDTDYLLVRDHHLPQALDALRQAGHEVN